MEADYFITNLTFYLCKLITFEIFKPILQVPSDAWQSCNQQKIEQNWLSKYVVKYLKGWLVLAMESFKDYWQLHVFW